MHRFIFCLLVLLPAPAFACMWDYIPSPPLQYLACGNLIAGIAAMFYVLRGHTEGSRLPEAITGAAFVAGLGLGALYAGGGNWGAWTGGATATVLLLFPYLAMRNAKGRAILVPLFLYVLLAAFATGAVFQGSKTEMKLYSSEPAVTHDVVF